MGRGRRRFGASPSAGCRPLERAARVVVASLNALAPRNYAESVTLPRAACYLVAGMGLGLALGVELATPRAPTAPALEPSRALASPAPVASRAPAAPQELVATIARIDSELQTLGEALQDLEGYGSTRALLADARAFAAARARREVLAARVGPAAPATRSFSWAARLERLLAAAGAGALAIPVAGEPGRVVRVEDADGRRRVELSQPLVGEATRVIRIEAPAGRASDRLEVRYCEGARAAVVREAVLPERPSGATWAAVLRAALAAGAVESAALEDPARAALVGAPGPSWFDWLRRDVGMPPNPDRGEADGPPPPLPDADPLLLGPDRAPVLLDLPTLSLDPDSLAPPVTPPARGPLVLIAANGLALHDEDRWSWLVFDRERRAAVQRLLWTEAAGRTRSVSWRFAPAPGLDAARSDEAFAAAAARAEQRTRQALALLAARRDVAALEAALAAKVGGLYTRDGLEALRLREAVLERHRRAQALSHLLLGQAGAERADRALREAERATVEEVVRVLEAMIAAGRSGPVEYLLRDARVKALLFRAPQAYRARLARQFQARFRPLGARLERQVRGDTPRWYEEVGLLGD